MIFSFTEDAWLNKDSSDIHDYSQKMKSELERYKNQLEGQNRIKI